MLAKKAILGLTLTAGMLLATVAVPTWAQAQSPNSFGSSRRK